jgi:hypothetical protein
MDLHQGDRQLEYDRSKTSQPIARRSPSDTVARRSCAPEVVLDMYSPRQEVTSSSVPPTTVTKAALVASLFCMIAFNRNAEVWVGYDPVRTLWSRSILGKLYGL